MINLKYFVCKYLFLLITPNILLIKNSKYLVYKYFFDKYNIYKIIIKDLTNITIDKYDKLINKKNITHLPWKQLRIQLQAVLSEAN